jgi:hypothetical protein
LVARDAQMSTLVPRLLRDLARLRADLGHVEPAVMPACEAMAGGDIQCECCGRMIMAGEPVDIFGGGAGWVYVHPDPCPEPGPCRLRYVWSGEQKCTHLLAESQALILAIALHDSGVASNIRLVRVRKGPARG